MCAKFKENLIGRSKSKFDCKIIPRKIDKQTNK